VKEILPSIMRMSDEFIVGMENANGLFDAIAKFGTINPFRSNTENLKVYREELQKLNKIRAEQIERGGIFGSTAAVDKDIADLEGKIKYLEALQKRLFKSTIQINPNASQDPRTGRGYIAPPQTMTRTESDALKKASEEALRERERYNEEMRALTDAQNQYQLDAIDKRVEAELEKEKNYQEMLQEFNEAQLENWNRIQDQRDAEIKSAADKFKAYADQLGNAFASSFEQAILTGKKLSDTLRDLAQDILKLVMRQAVTDPIAGLISSAITGSFGGARAEGGPVTGGSTYLVGERGPEMFVPRTSGMIVPNEAMGGSTTNNVVVNVNMQDGSITGQNATVLGGLIAGVVKQELVKQKRAGGLLA
jgi:nucleotide-binding universal stress UspA family protein